MKNVHVENLSFDVTVKKNMVKIWSWKPTKGHGKSHGISEGQKNMSPTPKPCSRKVDIFDYNHFISDPSHHYSDASVALEQNWSAEEFTANSNGADGAELL